MNTPVHNKLVSFSELHKICYRINSLFTCVIILSWAVFILFRYFNKFCFTWIEMDTCPPQVDNLISAEWIFLFCILQSKDVLNTLCRLPSFISVLFKLDDRSINTGWPFCCWVFLNQQACTTFFYAIYSFCFTNIFNN